MKARGKIITKSQQGSKPANVVCGIEKNTTFKLLAEILERARAVAKQASSLSYTVAGNGDRNESETSVGLVEAHNVNGILCDINSALESASRHLGDVESDVGNFDFKLKKGC